ncbi:MAG: DUF4147 domain-containing protein [Blautia sp.]
MISGGSSALMSCPIDGISLQDEIEYYGCDAEIRGEYI